MVWEDKGVVAIGRKLIGATNPLAYEPGTIHGGLASNVLSIDLAIHGRFA
ncbi:Nucleoside diphosphate kinase [Arachis hypogaea]|nr:Nucleoside diphosphate kinase [Arachis hypogaea]